MIVIGGLVGCVVGYVLARALRSCRTCGRQFRLSLIREAAADEEAADMLLWTNQMEEAAP